MPHTMEEINTRIAQSERDSAEGKVYDFEYESDDDRFCEEPNPQNRQIYVTIQH